MFFMAVVGLVACTSRADGSEDSGSAAVTLTLLSPHESDIVCGNPLRVETDIQNFTLTNETLCTE